MLQTEQSKYICEGYQQQQPISITVFHGGFTQSSDDYKILFYLKSVTVYYLTYLICLKVTDLTLTDVRKNEYEKLI